MTLDECCDKYNLVLVRCPDNMEYVFVDQTDEVDELWHLSDYTVTSVSGTLIYLHKK